MTLRDVLSGEDDFEGCVESGEDDFAGRVERRG